MKYLTHVFEILIFCFFIPVIKDYTYLYIFRSANDLTPLTILVILPLVIMNFLYLCSVLARLNVKRIFYPLGIIILMLAYLLINHLMISNKGLTLDHFFLYQICLTLVIALVNYSNKKPKEEESTNNKFNMKIIYFFSIIAIILTFIVPYSITFDTFDKPKEIMSYNCKNEKITVVKQPQTMDRSSFELFELLSDKDIYSDLFISFKQSHVTISIRKDKFKDKYIKLINCLKDTSPVLLIDGILVDKIGRGSEQFFEEKSCYISNPYSFKDFPNC